MGNKEHATVLNSVYKVKDAMDIRNNDYIVVMSQWADIFNNVLPNDYTARVSISSNIETIIRETHLDEDAVAEIIYELSKKYAYQP